MSNERAPRGKSGWARYFAKELKSLGLDEASQALLAIAKTGKKSTALPRGVYEKIPGSGDYWIRFADPLGIIRRQHIGASLSAASSLAEQRRTEVRLGKFDPESLWIASGNISRSLLSIRTCLSTLLRSLHLSPLGLCVIVRPKTIGDQGLFGFPQNLSAVVKDVLNDSRSAARRNRSRFSFGLDWLERFSPRQFVPTGAVDDLLFARPVGGCGWGWNVL